MEVSLIKVASPFGGVGGGGVKADVIVSAGNVCFRRYWKAVSSKKWPFFRFLL